jgi:septal ring factor EnvC (AmiA/AmiB activator)
MSSGTQSIYKIVILSAAFLICPGLTTGSSDPSTNIGATLRKQQEKFTATQEEIDRSKKKLRALEAREKPLDEELERLNQELRKQYAKEKKTRTQLSALRKRLERARAQRVLLEKEIQTLEEKAAERLVALYKLGKLGLASVIFSSQSFSEFLFKQKALEEISRYDSQLWTNLHRKKEAYASVGRQVSREEGAKKALLAQHQREKRQIAGQKKALAALLAAVRSDKARTQEYVASLRTSAERLEEIIKKLKAKQDRALQKAKSSRGAFLAKKGMLPPPVHGTLVEPYGAYEINGHYGTKGFRNGIHIQAEYGTPVKAVYGGEVIFAQPFKGYGNMVIIDHGHHYYTLSAQLAECLKKPADRVSSGDIIGTAGAVSSHGTTGVYFEIRHHGKPQDPMRWLSRSLR